MLTRRGSHSYWLGSALLASCIGVFVSNNMSILICITSGHSYKAVIHLERHTSTSRLFALLLMKGLA